MNNRKKINIAAISIMMIFNLLCGCKKEDSFLNQKPNISLVVPVTLQDYLSILQNERIFNTADPALGTLGSGEFVVTSEDWASAGTATERNAYIWSKDIYQNEVGNDWNALYQQVYYANVVLDGLKKVEYPAEQQTLYNQVRGTALFLRAYAFYNLVQTFSLPYNKASAGTDLGIPLRTSSDLNIKSTRATEQQCYDMITQDLIASLALLPSKVSFVTRPNITAANALLARIYLAIGNYQLAYKYANDCLSSNNILTDYNTIPAGTPNLHLSESSTYLPEEIYHTVMQNYDFTGLSRPIVDTMIYQSYDQNDLRKSLFFSIFNSHERFIGSYDYINYTNFSGLATDEIYLIRSECSVRLGDISAAVTDLNTLLVNRYVKGTFKPISSSISEDNALRLIINERIKELYQRGSRWTDLRRLNQDDRFKVTLTHTINGVSYSLFPNDPKYAYPIPNQEIQLSGLQQNIR